MIFCVRAQDAHSTAEEVLYQALWREGKPETRDRRMITIGYRGMSSLTRLDPKTVKYVLQNLISKLALVQVGDESSFNSIGRTYRVFSYKEILERRRSAGLEWITRLRGGGVVFCEPPERKSPTGGQQPTPPVRKLPTGAGGNLPTLSLSPPGGNLPPLRDNIVDIEQQQQLTDMSIPDVLQKYVPAFDADVVADLIRDCRALVSDATADEIAHFIDVKGDLLLRMTTVRNPIGFMRYSVPKCFEGPAFRQYRALERQRREALSHDSDVDDSKATVKLPQSDFVNELIGRGVLRRQAEELVSLREDTTELLTQIEYADSVIARNPGTFRNPPGFYVALIRDGVRPPASFESSRMRAIRQVRERDLHNQQIEEQNLRLEYEHTYRDRVIETYIREMLPADEYTKLFEEYKREARAEWQNLSDDTIADIAHGKIRGLVEPKVQMQTFEEWQSARADSEMRREP